MNVSAKTEGTDGHRPMVDSRSKGLRRGRAPFVACLAFLFLASPSGWIPPKGWFPFEFPSANPRQVPSLSTPNQVSQLLAAEVQDTSGVVTLQVSWLLPGVGISLLGLVLFAP